MKRFWLGIAVASALSACSGGNPFLDDPTDPEPPASGIPESVSSDLDSFSYDPASQTLTIVGVTFEGSKVETTYQRNAALDHGDYEAYTAQASPLDSHSTAYVRDINGTRGVVVATGGQFRYYNGGASYARSGAFDRPAANPNNENVKYRGDYVGLVNYSANTDSLLPVPPGTDPSERPGQAGRVQGEARIVADFAENSVKGIIFNRVNTDDGSNLADLELSPTAIADDGTFAGEVTIDLEGKGDYGGLFGGNNSEAVAGALFANEHLGEDSEEFGLFVLDKR